MNSSLILNEIAVTNDSPLKFKSNIGHSLIYFRKGSCTVNIDNKTFIAHHHSYILLRDDEQIILTNDHINECTIYLLSFSYTEFDHFTEESIIKCFDKESLAKCRYIISQSENSLRVRTLLLLLKLELKDKKYASEIFKSNTLSMLLIILNRVVLENVAPKKKACKKGLSLDDIFSYVNSHLKEDISLDKLAEDLFFSKYHILHEFKKKTGISLYKYIIKRKLEYSKTLIETGMPIREVYHNCGFRDYSNYFRSFKKEYNCTPKQYYNQVRSKNILSDINLELTK